MKILEIKELVRQRDGGCRDCGMTNEEHKGYFKTQLHVHRLIPNSKYSLDGTVALCRCCHKARHGTVSFLVPGHSMARSDERMRLAGFVLKAAWIRNADYKKLQSMSRREKVSKPNLVRRAIREYLERKDVNGGDNKAFWE